MDHKAEAPVHLHPRDRALEHGQVAAAADSVAGAVAAAAAWPRPCRRVGACPAGDGVQLEGGDCLEAGDVGQGWWQGFVEQGVHQGLLVEQGPQLVRDAGGRQALARQPAARGAGEHLLCGVYLWAWGNMAWVWACVAV